jgi:hypothetical protein
LPGINTLATTLSYFLFFSSANVRWLKEGIRNLSCEGSKETELLINSKYIIYIYSAQILLILVCLYI